MATAPIPIAASELVMMPLMHFDRSPPVMGPTLMGPCPPTLGRDSHLEYPSGPRVSTQQRTSGSWLCIHNREKKPNPTIAVINSPATGGRCHSRQRAPRDSQTSDSGEPNNECRRQKDEKRSMRRLRSFRLTIVDPHPGAVHRVHQVLAPLRQRAPAHTARAGAEPTLHIPHVERRHRVPVTRTSRRPAR